MHKAFRIPLLLRLLLSSMTWNIRESDIRAPRSPLTVPLLPFFFFFFLFPLLRLSSSRKGRRSIEWRPCWMDLSQRGIYAGWNNDPRPQMTRGAYLMLSPISRRVASGRCLCMRASAPLRASERVCVSGITRRRYEVRWDRRGAGVARYT